MAKQRFKPTLVTVTIDYDYDIHEISFPMRTLGRIASGRKVVVEGDGFNCEGEVTEDYWAFNVGYPGSLSVNCEDGRDLFDGSFVSDDEVTIDIYVSDEHDLDLEQPEGDLLNQKDTWSLPDLYKEQLRKSPLWKRMMKAWAEEAEGLLEKFTIQSAFKPPM